jgi:hypothetical protein
MKHLTRTEQTRRLHALRLALAAVLKSAPKKKRTALAGAIVESREISDEFLLDPLIDGRKLLAFVGAICRKG